MGFHESDGSSISIEVKRKSNANLLVHCTWQSNASDNIEKSNPQAETETEESPGGAGYSSGMFRGQKGDQYTGSPEAGSASDKRTGKSKKEVGSLPVLPPKIDRQKKPSKKSAAERLFGRSSGDRSSGGAGAGEEPGADAAETEDTPPETRVTGGFHSMPPSVAENNKKNTYDSNSSSFDSYNKHAAEGGYNGYSRSETEKSPAENNASDNAEKSDSEEETDSFSKKLEKFTLCIWIKGEEKVKNIVNLFS